MPYNPICEICHAGPKMDRCSCCERCWYSGAYRRAQDESASVRMMLDLGIPYEEVAEWVMDARHWREVS